MNLSHLETLRQRLLRHIRENKILLWGAGPHAQSVYDSLINLGRKDAVVGIFDSTRRLEQSPVEGVEVLYAEDIRKLSHDDHVVVGCAGLNELYGYIVPEHLFYFRIFHRRAVETCLELEGRIDEVQNNIDLFTDDLSKKIYQQRLELLLSSIMFMESFKTEGGPYAYNDLVAEFGEKWMYAGAYNGKHLERALTFNPDQKILAVEPSPKMFEALANRYRSNPNISIHNYLLWSKSSLDMAFVDDSKHQGLAASVFIPEQFGTTEKIQTITIDDLVGDDFISDLALDVEGSEQHAVAGAQELLQRQQTRCSVCIYHNLDDYLKVPGQLNKIMSPGTLAIRHHSCIPLIETVAYALP